MTSYCQPDLANGKIASKLKVKQRSLGTGPLIPFEITGDRSTDSLLNIMRVDRDVIKGPVPADSLNFSPHRFPFANIIKKVR